MDREEPARRTERLWCPRRDRLPEQDRAGSAHAGANFRGRKSGSLGGSGLLLYGRSHEFREWLEEQQLPYAVMVPETDAVPLRGRKEKIEQLAERLGGEAYSEVVPTGDSGERRPWE
jgi:hypothetical protein